jgi:hypothetical protein
MKDVIVCTTCLVTLSTKPKKCPVCNRPIDLEAAKKLAKDMLERVSK